MIGYVKSYVLATAVNGRQYAKCSVINDTTSATFNVWGAPAKLYTGYVVKYNDAKLTTNDKGSSINFLDLLFDEVKNYPEFYKFVESAATESELDTLISHIHSILSPKNKEWILKIVKGIMNRYENYPAARSNHHAFVGGLSRHTYELLNIYVGVHKSLPFKVNPDIVVLACLFHDYGKMVEYTKEFELTDLFYLQGHPVISAMEASKVMDRYTDDVDFKNHVIHCILAHHGRKEWGSPVEPATPEAFLVHHLDMLSGHGYTYEHASKGEKQFALGGLPVIKYGL